MKALFHHGSAVVALAVLAIPTAHGQAYPAKPIRILVGFSAGSTTDNYSSPGIGSANHLAGELLKSLARVDVTHVPFKGIPEALTAAMTGAVTFNLSPIVNVLPLAKGGKVTALATSTGKRAAAMPELPTIAEAGVPGYAFDPWFGLLTTANTPRPVVAMLNQEVTRILGLADVKPRLLALGAEPTPTTPEQFDAHVRVEIAKFRKIVQDANIRVE